jgi:3-oxoadipate enol-lactonase
MAHAALHHAFDGPTDAPVVVLASALGTTGDVWDPVLPALAQRNRVLRYDHRGHGASAAPPGPYDIADLVEDLLSLLDRHDIDRAAVCGLSIGGMVALRLALDHSRRVDRLVLIASSAAPDNETHWSERAAAVRARGLEPLADGIMSRWATPAFRRRDPGAWAGLRAAFTSNDPEGYASCCDAIRTFDVADRLREITAPTLVIGADRDESLPLDHQQRLHDGIPGSTLAVIEGAAHIPFLDRPADVARAVEDGLMAPAR